MIDLERARALGAKEDGAAVAIAITIRADGTPAASVVNAGVLAHPRTGQEVVGSVALGAARRLSHLRRRPRVTVAFAPGPGPRACITLELGLHRLRNLSGPVELFDVRVLDTEEVGTRDLLGRTAPKPGTGGGNAAP